MIEEAKEKRIKTLVISGPTAAGKTEYAVKIGMELGGEIISADSMQIYKYLDIGSAKPSLEDMKKVKHFMISEIDPKSPFSVAEYRKTALCHIKDTAKRGKLPIVCGGTGLYINSLVRDMDFSAPAGSLKRREEISKECFDDPEKIHERLFALSPEAATKIHKQNVKRALRAIERLEGGEKEYHDFSNTERPSRDIDPIMICLERKREDLYAIIEKRVDKFFDIGLEDEVKRLMEMGFTEEDVSMKGIGYKEVMRALEKGLPGRSASEEIKRATRRYAKRQETWLRRYKDMKHIVLSGKGFDENAYNEMLVYIKSLL